jgi:hypothetical protein
LAAADIMSEKITIAAMSIFFEALSIAAIHR